MRLKDLITEDRAVSPVIGVILMVAITVILAAVIGTFVLGLGDKVDSTTPRAAFDFEYANYTGANDGVVVTHTDGDTIPARQLNASVSGAVDGSGDRLVYVGDLFGSSGDVSSGTTGSVGASGHFASNPSVTNLAPATIRVVWSGESGDNSAVLAKWTGPNA
ncbi:type IV pilin [Halobellus sp. Atlit-38R]|uniref:type IV pilin n=1 Tax=Halobellus sp. Atlit-38R TaxID=2282131 RepID=UPI000EF27091|nr:type IV pilin N-terminal domain-containing protein [Halobellus sp. Atlit-38R]RLM89171.1 type IV pilin [Halobellus sp. Atlit-38R]